MKKPRTTFRCTSCGEEHDVLGMAFVAPHPVQWELLTPEEREQSFLTPDQCVIHSDNPEATSFYIRACLDIPLRGTDKTVQWGVWCSLSERSFEEMSEHWEDPERTKLGPYFGWFSNVLETYPDTLNLKAMVHQRALGLRPLVALEPTEHPLAVHQHEGIEFDEWAAMVERLLHPKA